MWWGIMDSLLDMMIGSIIVAAVYIMILFIPATAKDADENPTGRIATFLILTSWPFALALISIRMIDAYFDNKNPEGDAE